MSYVVTAFRPSRSINYDGHGARHHMIVEIYADEPRARQRAQDLVEVGGCQWATYDVRKAS